MNKINERDEVLQQVVSVIKKALFKNQKLFAH